MKARLVALLVVALVVGACGGGGDDGVGAPAQVAGSSGKATVVGDSVAFAMGAELRNVVDPRVEVKVIAEGGTGLARPDVFDWPTRLDALATDFPPEVLVVSVGSNDHQDLTDASGEVVVAFSDEAAWDAEYSRRLSEVFDHFADTGTTVVWVGQMHSADPLVGSTNRRVHRLATEVAGQRPFVVVADLGDWLGTGEEPASDCLEPDGVHLSETCTARAAEALAAVVEAEVPAEG